MSRGLSLAAQSERVSKVNYLLIVNEWRLVVRGRGADADGERQMLTPTWALAVRF